MTPRRLNISDVQTSNRPEQGPDQALSRLYSGRRLTAAAAVGLLAAACSGGQFFSAEDASVDGTGGQSSVDGGRRDAQAGAGGVAGEGGAAGNAGSGGMAGSLDAGSDVSTGGNGGVAGEGTAGEAGRGGEGGELPDAGPDDAGVDDAAIDARDSGPDVPDDSGETCDTSMTVVNPLPWGGSLLVRPGYCDNGDFKPMPLGELFCISDTDADAEKHLVALVTYDAPLTGGEGKIPYYGAFHPEPFFAMGPGERYEFLGNIYSLPMTFASVRNRVCDDVSSFASIGCPYYSVGGAYTYICDTTAKVTDTVAFVVRRTE